jgi:hypothetical protein
VIESWRLADEPILLLNIPPGIDLPASVRAYLETEAASTAKRAYKCRVRDPWYSVPDVQTPKYFLAYMSGLTPTLVHNEARCTGTNSVLCVRPKATQARQLDMLGAWQSPVVQLSCEIEGHPLGGGMLKLEPREAARIILPETSCSPAEIAMIEEATNTMRRWRHRDVAR